MLNSIARPFGIVLMFLYESVQNYGLSIILFALLIKIILLPFQMKSKYGMMRQQRLQPKIAELQKKHGANKQKLNEETAKMYKEEGINPASGCLWGFLPLPIMLALFQVIRQPLTTMMGVARDLLAAGPPVGAILDKLQQMNFTSTVQSYYVEISQSQFISNHFSVFAPLSQALRQINFNFLGIDLGIQPQWNFLWTTSWKDSSIWLPGLVLFIIPLLSGGSQLYASILNKKLNPVVTPDGAPGGGSMQAMLMLMPLFSIYIAFITPAALGFYWTISTIFQIVQDVLLTKMYTKKIDAEEAVKNEQRKKKEAEIEAKRIETEKKKAEGQLVERNPNTSKRKKQKSDKQDQIGKAVEWEKKHSPVDDTESEPSRVENRRFARGRAYDPDRYAGDPDAGGAEGGNSETKSRKSLPKGDTADKADGVGSADADEADETDEVDSEDADDDTDGADAAEDDAEDDAEDNAEDDAGEDIGEDVNSDDAAAPEAESHEANPTVRFDTTRFENSKDEH